MRYPTCSVVRAPEVSHEVVDDFQVLHVADVGGKYVSRYSCVVGNAVEKCSLDFIKAFFDVGRASGKVSFVKRGMLYVYCGGVPGVGGADTWYTGKHVVGGPGVDPWFEIVEASAGPEAVGGGSDEKRTISQGISCVVGVLFKVGGFGGEHAFGPGGASFYFVIYLGEPYETQFAEELEVGSVPFV